MLAHLPIAAILTFGLIPVNGVSDFRATESAETVVQEPSRNLTRIQPCANPPARLTPSADTANPPYLSS